MAPLPTPTDCHGPHPGAAVLIVIPCGATKQNHRAPAAELYSSANFAFTLAAARSEAADTTRVCGRPAAVAILSALHGLVDPEDVLDPYDVTMGQPGCITAAQLADQLRRRRPAEIVAMLPRAYLEVLAAAITLANGTDTDIALLDAYEAAPGIGYQRGVAASLLRTAGTLPGHAESAPPRNFLVRWEIDAEGFTSPRQAAEFAAALHKDPAALVGCFTVIDRATGASAEVDLDEPVAGELS